VGDLPTFGDEEQRCKWARYERSWPVRRSTAHSTFALLAAVATAVEKVDWCRMLHTAAVCTVFLPMYVLGARAVDGTCAQRRTPLMEIGSTHEIAGRLWAWLTTTTSALLAPISSSTSFVVLLVMTRSEILVGVNGGERRPSQAPAATDCMASPANACAVNRRQAVQPKHQSGLSTGMHVDMLILAASHRAFLNDALQERSIAHLPIRQAARSHASLRRFKHSTKSLKCAGSSQVRGTRQQPTAQSSNIISPPASPRVRPGRGEDH
jgi:hypothetical protein